MKLRLLLVALVLCLAACTSPGPVPQPKFFRLESPTDVPALPAPLVDGVLLVRPFAATDVNRERAVLFSEGKDGLDLQQHHYHYWADSPPRLLQTRLAEELRARHAAPMVVTDSRTEADLIVSGRIIHFERRISESGVIARVALELRVERAGMSKPVFVQAYSAEVAASDDSIDASIPAFNTAVDRIFADFIRDAEVRLRSAGTAGPSSPQ